MIDAESAKVLYEDLSIIHQYVPEDWQRRLVEILRAATNLDNLQTFHQWEKDHGYRNR